MRLMVCAGATGGGINPALAVLQALGSDKHEVLWVGAERGMEADLVPRAGIPFTTVPAGGIHGVGLRIFSSLVKLARGYFAARKLVAEFKPEVLFFTGGYVAIPVGLAGRKIPTLICLPDIEPALAIRTLSRFAERITVPAEDSKKYFRANKEITVTGYPTRPSLMKWDKAKAYEEFRLSPDLPTIFVTGGSLGARSINRAMIHVLPELLGEFQVIHSSGTLTWPEVEKAQKTLPPELANNYRAFPFLHENMGAAFTIADLVITRGGGSILGELPMFGVPGVLAPYPHAWRYQIVNANYLAEKGAAVVVRDEDLDKKLSATVQELLHNKLKLGRMKTAMQSLARPDAAHQIAAILQEMGAAIRGSA